MLEFNTEKNLKTVNIDGYTYKVRKLGAGESLIMQKSGRELTKLDNTENRTPDQEAHREQLTIELLDICFNIFTPDNDEAKSYLNTLDVEVLLDVINKIFETKDEQSA